MTVLSILAALASTGLTAPIHTSGTVEIVQITVQHADLNLADGAAQRRLAHRVRAAIENICSSRDRGLRATSQANECRKLARAQTETQVRFAIARANAAKARLAATELGAGA